MGKRFLADIMLGRLARWLRILGYDAIYAQHGIDSEIMVKAYKEKRIILTRNRKLYKRIGHKGAIFINFDNFRDQLYEVMSNLELELDEKNFFSRCLDCNLELAYLEKDKAKTKVPAFVFHSVDVFRTCPECGRIFWSGTHTEEMKKQINEFLKERDK